MKIAFLKILIISLLVFDSLPTFSQTITDSAAAFPFVRFQYQRVFPGGDFETTYGSMNEIGGAIGYKTKSNWQFDIEAGYYFGADIKRKDMLNDIINSDGSATDSDGELIKLLYEIRGMNILASVGKIIPISKKNPNSGILLKAGAGFLQHRIKVDFRDGTAFQLSDENLKGYDRLHRGVMFRQFIGYQYYGVKNLLSFYIGFEFNEALTYNKREYNYDERAFDTDQKLDILHGFRFGWTIPIRSRNSEEFYYY
tara:strand:- start:3047 stop:3808 length:762 start_codon:yes stop_codon:yes gene_type:complete